MQMNYTVEDASTVKKILHIEISRNEIAKEIDDAYRELNKTAKVKGFRPGKTPRAILERLYGKEVLKDITSRLINESCENTIKESGLVPLTHPVVELPDLSLETDYKYSATIEIRPEVSDIDFKGLSLKKTKYVPTDEEINAQLAMLQKNFSEFKPIEFHRPVAKGDIVVIDYEGFQDGAPYPNFPKIENSTVKIGSATVSAAFDDQIIGMLPGESKEFTTIFPSTGSDASRENLEILFRVRLHEIREEICPELNDEFAQKAGNFKGMEDIRKTIYDNLVEGYVKRSELELYEQILSALIEKTSFEVPAALIDFEIASIIHEFERSLGRQQMTLESQKINREVLAATYHDTAEKLARRHLVLGKIIAQEKLTLTDDELDNALRDIAIFCEKPFEEVKSVYHQNANLLNSFKEMLLEKKAFELIIDNGVIEEVTPVLEYPENIQVEDFPAQ